jgi:hypothetical protein
MKVFFQTQLFFLFLVFFSQVKAQNARLQIIHNCADPAASSVSVWVQGQSTALVPSLAFREATPYVDLPAGTYTVEIKGASATQSDPAIFSKSFTLNSNTDYVVIATGVIGTGFAANPGGASTAFDLVAFGGRKDAADATKAEIILYHGATDAPDVALHVFNPGVDTTTIISSLAFANSSGAYLPVDGVDALVALTPANTAGPIVAVYQVPFSALVNQTAVVFASGFAKPDSNGTGASSFGVWYALSDGTVGQLTEPTTRLQAIHNAADPALSNVDLNIQTGPISRIAVPGLLFRSATPFVDAPAYTPLNITFKVGTTEVPINLPGLDPAKKYIAVAHGVASTTGFNTGTNPNISFTLSAIDYAEETAPSGNVHLLAFHGVTDAPSVDILNLADNSVVYSALTYSNFSPAYVPVPVADLTIGVRATGQSTILKAYSAPLATLNTGGLALTVFASGFLDSTQNQNGSSFGLYAALPNGNVVALPEVIVTQIGDELNTNDVVLYPNPANDKIMLQLPKNSGAAYEIKIFNLQGSEIYDFSSKITPDGFEINTNHFTPGIYMLKLHNQNNSITKRMVISK